MEQHTLGGACAGGRQWRVDLYRAVASSQDPSAERGGAGDWALEILESITDAFLAIDRSWRFTYVNRQAHRLLDRAPGDLIGTVLWEEFPGLIGTEFETAYRRAAEDRIPSRLTAWYAPHNRWYEVYTCPAAHGIAIYFRDATENKQAEEAIRRSEEAQRLVVAINDATRQLGDPVAITRQVVTLVGRHFGVSRCMFAEIDTGLEWINVPCDYTDHGVLSLTGTHRLENFGPKLIGRLREGHSVAIDDVQTDALTADPRTAAGLGAIQARAVLTVPLLQESRPIAAFSLHQSEPRRWSPTRSP